MKSTKKRSKWRDARNRLLKLAARKPVNPYLFLGKPVFGQVPPGLRPKELPPDLEKLKSLLARIGDHSEVYSFVLQTFLAAINIDWPDGVFTNDFALPDRGRCLSSLSINSWHLYDKYGFGWRNVAKELIPKEYENDPAKAANRVRKAARSFIAFRESVLNSMWSRRPEIQKRLEELLWAEGLDNLAWRAIERKFLDGLSEPAPPHG